MKKLLLSFALLLQVFLAPAQKPGCIYLDYTTSGIDHMTEIAVTDYVKDLFRYWQVTVTTSEDIYTVFDRFHRAKVVLQTWSALPIGGYSDISSTILGIDTVAFIYTENLDYFWKYIAEATAHEVGHMLGLQHQSEWVKTPKNQFIKLSEYNTGTWLVAPIMGASYWSYYAIWWKGSDAYGHYQDDFKVISKTFLKK